ncbi:MULTISPECIES: hypothetical protein [Marinobacter]|uniref:Secreted protein n=1 Tax=Marinobacter metalliresistant TaxID=2961995 RepID=A0ABZ2VYK9_9GAMM|nr:hypothetical protein [Marinobacter sp. Arc7-DN-1]
MLRLVIILALGLDSLLAYSAENTPVLPGCEPVSCLLCSDAMGDGAQEGDVPGSDRLRDFTLTPGGILCEIRSFSGLVPCASFPVLPQAPPLA